MEDLEAPHSTASLHGWRKHREAYRCRGNSLQTVDIWTPPSPPSSSSTLNTTTTATSATITSTSAAATSAASITTTSAATSAAAGTTTTNPRPGGVWIIYIHGGAWRDARIDSSSFAATASHVLSSPSRAALAGLASLNYSLSRDPRSTGDDDPAHAARHPQHIADVRAGLAHLRARYGVGVDSGSACVLVGHSCGATLALQAVMDGARWEAGPGPEGFGGDGGGAEPFAKPCAVVGVNGLYDLPALVHEPGPRHEGLAKVYEEFVRGAFGEDERVWRDVSPARAVAAWNEEWSEGRLVVLAQSGDDTLVPRAQTERMMASLAASKAEDLVLMEVDIGGDHDDVWKEGGRLAEILLDVVRSLGSV